MTGGWEDERSKRRERERRGWIDRGARGERGVRKERERRNTKDEKEEG